MRVIFLWACVRVLFLFVGPCACVDHTTTKSSDSIRFIRGIPLQPTISVSPACDFLSYLRTRGSCLSRKQKTLIFIMTYR